MRPSLIPSTFPSLLLSVAMVANNIFFSMFQMHVLFCVSGIFTVAFDSQIEWLMVKGIADFADGVPLNAESWCSCASLMTASLVKHILSNAAVFRSWPHFDGNYYGTMFFFYYFLFFILD